MHIHFRNRRFVGMAAAAMLLAVSTVRGEDKPQAGVVRITDKAPTNSQMAPAGHSHGEAVHGPVVGHHHGCNGQCQHGCGGNVVHVGPEYEYTGHFLHDICTTMRMKTNAWCTKRRLQRQAESGCESDCDSHDCSLKCRLFGCRQGDNCNECEGRGCSLCRKHSRCDHCNGRGCNECGGDGQCNLHDKLDNCLARHRKRYGYFHPTGGGGHGLPWAGGYHMSYAVNPEHYDFRDGGVYAAPGYGIPMAVPLAPNVNHTYNYGWGIPSSRLTPVSRRVREPGIIPAMQPVVMPPPPYPAPRPGVPAAGVPGVPGSPAGPAYPGATPPAQPAAPENNTEAGA